MCRVTRRSSDCRRRREEVVLPVSKFALDTFYYITETWSFPWATHIYRQSNTGGYRCSIWYFMSVHSTRKRDKQKSLKKNFLKWSIQCLTQSSLCCQRSKCKRLWNNWHPATTFTCTFLLRPAEVKDNTFNSTVMQCFLPTHGIWVLWCLQHSRHDLS